MKFSLAGKSILVVEDYLAMRKAIRDMLYTLDADNVYEADSGISALNAMSKNSFDAVLCDYNLGNGKNGQQVLEDARFRKLLPYRCVFVIISADQSTSMVLGAMDSKPDEYLAKPFNAQQLASRLQRHFARKEFLADAEMEIERGNLAKAIEICDGLLSAGDKIMHTHLLKLRAELATKIGDFDTAAEIYHGVLANRELPWAQLGLGIILFQQNKAQAAVELFEQFVRDHPLLLEGYDWLSRSYEALNAMQEVQTVLCHAVDLSPQSILRQKKLAVTADRNGHPDIAEKAYQATVALGKYSIYKSSSDFAGLAKLYSKNNAVDKAFRTLDAMRAEFVNSPESELRAATLECELYKNSGNDEQSALALQKVMELGRRTGGKIPKDLLLDISKACFLHNETETAEEILHGLIKTHIDDEAFLNDIRRMQAGIGMDNHSEVFIQRTKRALIVTNNKGVALYKEGRYREALELFDQAIATMPDNKTIMLNMLKIMVYELKNGELSEDKLQRAKALFKKAGQVGIEPHKIGSLKAEFDNLLGHGRQRSPTGSP